MKSRIIGILLFALGLVVGSQYFQRSSAVHTSQEVQSNMHSASESEEAGSLYANQQSAQATNLTPEETSTIKLFENAAPSVVFITTSSVEKDRYSMNVYEIPKGSGSGFLWDSDGHVVTNFHVVDGSDRFNVTLSNNISYQAKLVGAAPEKDLAVLKIEATYDNLKPLPVGKSQNLRVGQSVLAIGNPFGLDQTLTTGIISALGREIKAKNGTIIDGVIQTDAAINPGNSGGPLLDSSGKLIGVNTAIYSPSGAYAGIGFSIPVDEVAWVIPDLINYGRVKRPYLGVELVPNQYFSEPGAMIKAVSPTSPAGKAGLRGVRQTNAGVLYGDIIVKLNGMSLKSNADVTPILEKFKPGDKILVEFLRDSKRMQTELILGSSVNPN